MHDMCAWIYVCEGAIMSPGGDSVCNLPIMADVDSKNQETKPVVLTSALLPFLLSRWICEAALPYVLSFRTVVLPPRTPQVCLR
jgi:hypothetical protein